MRENKCLDCPKRIALKARRCVACAIAKRAKVVAKRAQDKLSRASKPLPTVQQLWDTAMSRENRKRTT